MNTEKPRSFGEIVRHERRRLLSMLVIRTSLSVAMLLLVTGGIAVPLDRFPEGVRSLLELLPAAALAEGLRECLSDGTGLPLDR